MKNRKLLLIVSLVLALTMSLGGTLAYLTDTDEAVNVMTLGNVKVEQLELQRAEGVAHNAGEAGAGNGVKKADNALVPFVQGQALYPAYPVNGLATDYSAEPTDLFYWGDYVYSGTAGNGLWNDNKLKGALDKFVFVENTGSSPAYFRTWIAFECPEGMAYSEGSDKEFMMNVSGSTLYKWDNVGYATIEGQRYLIMCATYQNALAAGNTSHPSLLQVVMTHNATNEDMELLGKTYEILAFTQAVQTNNFENADQALTAAFGAVTVENQPWGNDVNGLPTTTVSTAAELKAALAEGGIIVVAKDIVVEDTLEVPAGVTATLNLAGHTISQTKACTDSYAMIANNGTLTITGNGKLSFTDTGDGDPNVGWASYTIRNAGTLIVEDGTIEHLGTQTYNGNNAIFHYSGSTTIKGGNISAPYSRSLRVWNGEATIAGGTFDGQVWVQAMSNCKLTITGGSFKPATNGNDGSSVYVTNDTKDVAFSVTGGNFATKIGCSNADKLAGCITGGTFTEAAQNGTNPALFAE